jgi:hypothetical protein
VQMKVFWKIRPESRLEFPSTKIVQKRRRRVVYATADIDEIVMLLVVVVVAAAVVETDRSCFRQLRHLFVDDVVAIYYTVKL